MNDTSIENLLREEKEITQQLYEVSKVLSADLKLNRIVQFVTDASVKMLKAKFGAFFYNVIKENGEAYVLYSLSGAPPESFANFPMPRNTAVFGPTFKGEKVIRSDDITKDPRYGKNYPFNGMPPGHLPVKSYLAVPVISRGEDVIGGLFFGHPEAGVFEEKTEQIAVAIASQAAVVIDNARLYERSQRELQARAAAEKALRQLNRKLEQLISDRTSELNMAVKELESFSYSVSHDLRTPLRSIDGFSHLLLEETHPLTPEQRQDYLRRIRAATQRMGHLIDDMLTLSKVTRQDLQIEKINMSQMVKAITDDLKCREPERPAQFIIQEGVEGFADPVLLQSVLENLIGNAWKFSEKQSQTIIEFGLTSDSDNSNFYFVRDEGAGFEMAYADKLFGPFQRLHGRKEFSGTGIGLATAQRIIHRHGGRIWAEGKVNQGATFYFTLGQPTEWSQHQ